MSKKKFFGSLVITFLILSVIFACMVLFTAGEGQYYDFLDENTDRTENVLVVGIDKEGKRADVIMLFNVNPKDKTINMVSVPRDTKIKLDNGKISKINACLGKENGEEMLCDYVRELTGQPINSFCKVNFEGLRNVVDILGGIKYNVPMDMDYDDPVQDLHIHLKAGEQVLDGSDVEGLLRFRSGYANADLGRIDTQQDFLKEAISQKLSLKYVFKLPAIMAEVHKSFDTDLSTLDVFTLAFNARSCNSLSTYTLPGGAKYSGGASYYVADDDTDKQISALLGKPKASSELNDKVID